MGDRVIISQFERAYSADVNDLQSMLRRQLHDVFRYFGAQRPHPSAVFGPFNGTQVTPDTFFSGCEVVKLNSTTVQMGQGFLAVESPDNLTIGLLDSNLQIGINRAAKNITLPVDVAATGGNRYLMSARCITVVTLSEAVDIFDVPSQTFVPTVKDRKSELQIETRFDAGPLTTTAGRYGFAAFDVVPANQGWQPLCHVEIYANTADPDHGHIYDCRRDIRDVLRAQDQDTIVNQPGAIGFRSVQSGGNPTSGSASGIKGWFRADVKEKRYQLQVPVTEDGRSPTSLDDEVPYSLNTLTHLYLVPFVKGSIIRAPSFSETAVRTQRGWLVATQDPALSPNQDGVNPVGLRLPYTGSGLWANFDVVPAGHAVHVCSYTSTGGAGGVQPRYFTMVGERHQYHGNEDDSAAPVVFSNSISASGSPNVYTIDMSLFVPKNARAMRIRVHFDHTNVDQNGGHFWASCGWSEVASIPADRVAAIGSGSFGAGVGTDCWIELEVPIFVPDGFDPVSTLADHYLTNFRVKVSTDLTIPAVTAVPFEVTLLGWEF